MIARSTPCRARCSKRVREERPVDEREHVLARAVGERSEPRALPADEDDRGKAHSRSPDALVGEARARASRRDRAALRPSTSTRSRIRSPAAAQSSSRSSGHSVTTHRRVRAVERLERRLGDLDTVQVRRAVRDRVPGAHLGPLGEEPAREDEARRLAHVVRAGLEREAEERDPLAAQRPEAALELPDDASLLQLVHLDDRVQELEVVARVRRELLERERVLREAASRRSRSRRGGRTGRSGDRGRCPRRPSTTSAPVASQTLAISLMKEMRVTSAAFAASLIISADGDVAAHDRRVDALVERLDDVPVGLVERADDDAVGLHEVADGRPLGRELRVRDVADVRRARDRRAGAGRRVPCRPGTVLFIATTMRRSTPGSSSTTVQTAERSASPEYVGGVPTATYTTSAPSTASADVGREAQPLARSARASSSRPGSWIGTRPRGARRSSPRRRRGRRRRARARRSTRR